MRSSTPAPETVQMVTSGKRSGSGSDRSGSSSARRCESRLPSMQLVRSEDARPSKQGPASASSNNNDEVCGASWMVAVAAPLPMLHGFCLAVIGLQTRMVGANVTVVDRAAVVAEEEAATGFLGFDKVRRVNC